ncbi:MAG: EpsG family protein [Polaromonas sp.]|nr:EpsG family protein [Polaromonas sp.]
MAFVLLVLMIGLRHEVGADWETYADYVRMASYQSLEEAVMKSDPAYGLLNWLAAQTDLGPYFVNTAGAALFSWGLVSFCRAQPRPWLALAVAVPYLVTVVAMGYTRQGVAIGLVMLGLVALSERKISRFVVFVVLAATFHKSAVIMMPLAVLAGTKRRTLTVLWVGLVTLLFYVLLLQESVEVLNTAYIVTEYSSAGAAVRVAMNAMPALIFLSFRRRFTMPKADRIFWTWVSLGALAFIAVLMVSPSSTAVDRVALYWIPLQLLILSRLPDALGQQNGQNALWVLAIVLYSAAVLFVWLLFADNAFAWLPYQFYPWVVLWR